MSELSTPAILILAPSAGTRTTSERATNLGLNILKSAPSEIRMLYDISAPQPGHAMYSTNFGSFMSASNQDRFVRFDHKWHSFTNRGSTFPIHRPAVGAIMRGRDNDAVKSFLNKTPHTIFKDRKDTIHIFDRPTAELLRYLQESPSWSKDVKTRISRGTDLTRLALLTNLERLIAAAVATNSYPAYINDDHFKNCVTKVVEQVPKGKGKKRKTTEDVAYTSVQGWEDEGDEEGDEGDQDMDNEESEAPTPEVVYYRAKPNELGAPSQSKTFTTNANVMWIPFFDFASREDSNGIRNFLQQHCRKLLGRTLKSEQKAIDEMMRAYQQVCLSVYGHTLTHIIQCFQISLNTQTVSIPIIQEGEYFGSVILGTGYSISKEGKLHKPALGETLGTLIRQYGSNDIILTKAGKIAGLDLTKCKSMRDVHNLVMESQISPEELGQMKCELARLRFSTSYWKTTPSCIAAVIVAIVDMTDLDRACPMHYSAVGSKSHVIQTLAVFGPTAPSLLIPGGIKIMVSQTKLPKRFHMALKSLPNAASDWSTILHDGYVTMPNQQMHTKNKYPQIRNGDDLWNTLRECHDELTGSSTELQRDRSDSEEDDHGDGDNAATFGGF